MSRVIDLTPYEPYPMTSLRTLWAVPPPEMLVENFLPKASVTAIVSYPGVGKTWLSLELGRAVSTGTPFLNKFPVTKQGNVVFVGQDASIHDYAQQIRKLVGDQYREIEDEVARGNVENNPFEEKYHFIIDPGFLFEDSTAVLRMVKSLRGIVHGERVEEFDGGKARVVGDKGTDLVVFDTYSAMTRVNQNDNTLAEINFRNLRLIAKLTGAAVVLLHHNSKRNEYNEGEDIRGASAQVAALDCWFNLINPPRGPRDRYLLKVKRFRGLKPDDFHYYLKVDKERARVFYADEDNDPGSPAEGTASTEGPDNVATVIIDCLAANRGHFFLASEIADRTWEMGRLLSGEINEESWQRKVRRRLKDLTAYVEIGPSRGNRPTYRLKEVADDSDAQSPIGADSHDDASGTSEGGTEAPEVA